MALKKGMWVEFVGQDSDGEFVHVGQVVRATKTEVVLDTDSGEMTFTAKIDRDSLRETAAPKRARKRQTAQPKVAAAVKKPKIGTKMEQAVAIFKELKGDRAAVIAALQDRLDMSKAGATTYFYSAKKKA